MLLGSGCRLLALVAAEILGSLAWRGWALNAALPLQLEWHEALQAGRISSPNRSLSCLLWFLAIPDAGSQCRPYLNTLVGATSLKHLHTSILSIELKC